MLTMLTFLSLAVMPLETPVGDQPAEVPAQSTESRFDPTEGIWPSKKLMESLLVRWSDGVTADYDLDDTERRKVREAVVKRWSSFFNENRAGIQPLINEFLELRLAPEAPSRESVQAWAGRAGPALKLFREQLLKGTDDFREVLDPVERARLELDAFEFGLGVQIAQDRLAQWQKGEFKVEEFWEPPRGRRAERQAQRPQRPQRQEKSTSNREGAKPKPRRVDTDQIALEVGAWEAYVEDFIKTYELDEGQRDAATSCLAELKARALAHRDKRREDIKKLEQRIVSNAGSDKELAEIKTQLVELYGPIDAMFQELQRRVEQIPTGGQRAAVKRPATTTPAPKEKPIKPKE